ncbi:MAG: beta-CASP ribonuclease aCPSF1 [Candidatus Woesearchaeota archaeon]
MILPSEIIQEILKDLPSNKISEACFEGANIVLYTKDINFFLDDNGIIREIVNKIKKRIELRPDPAVCLSQKEAEKEIRAIVGEEAGIENIFFDPERSMVTVEVNKPGIAIGKQGENILKIKQKTLWIPLIKRVPPIRSQLIENIRAVLFQSSDYRKKFLNKVGERIYNGWLRAKKEEWIRVTYLGSGRQVGRSALFLQTPESRILLDCGIDVASEREPYPFLEVPEFDIKELDAVIISHAHVDHSGFLPYLFKFGYRGPVYCTPPTRDVMALLQLDIVKIMRNEGEDPIFASEEVKEVVKHTITLNYEEVTDITPDVRLTFYNAGHILGSAMVHLHIGNGLHNLLYTGDLKYAKSNLLSAAETSFPRLETLMIESTYGGREANMPTTREQEKLFAENVVKTLNRGGKVLCPVLGVGRSQEIIVAAEKLIREGLIPSDVSIYIDGMVWDITAIHTAYPEFLNSVMRKQIFHKDNNPFLMPNIKRVGSQKERQQVIEDAGPCIILATSGMLVGGPSVQYLRSFAEDKRHTLVFTCYQGEGSLGRMLLMGGREFNYRDGKNIVTVSVLMEVLRYEITGHSDRKELMSFVQHLNPRPKKVIVNHGENSRCLDLSKSIHQLMKIETVSPRNLETIRIK